MATYEKRDNGYRFRVRKGGVDRSETFRTLSEGKAWAAQMEADIAARRRGCIPDRAFGELIERYLSEVTPKKRGARQEELRLRRTMGRDDDHFRLGNVRLPALDETHIAQWRDWRLSTVGPASTRREWAVLSHACNIAIKEWKWLTSNPFSRVSKPPANRPRSRRPEGNELDAILHALGYNQEGALSTTSARVGAAAIFAVETAMRAGEICSLTPESIRGRVAHLDKTKNGDERNVPLSSAARDILARLPKTDGTLFGVSVGSLDALWRKAKRRAGVDGLHFHDLRREATTRLATKFDVLTLAKITGHRDIQLLARVYYAPTMEDLADRLE